MMLLVIGSETIFFISLMLGYVMFWRSGHLPASSRSLLNIKLTGAFTVLLVASSFTFFMAERSYRHGKQQGLNKWLLATIVLALIFLCGQAHEYYGLFQKEVSLSSSVFGSNFFTLTGFHALHVIIGIIMLGILLLLSFKGFLKQSTLFQTIGIYWHFVDVVWLVVFTLIYVIPYL